MKRMISRGGLVIVLMIFILSPILSSCVTTKARQIDTQKRGFMVQDKSMYTMNKGKFKGSKAKSLKIQKKKIKKLKRRRKRW